MRPRRHLVEQQPAVGRDEKLDSQQPDEIDCLCKRRRGALRRLFDCWNDRSRGHSACKNAVLVAILANREMHHVALCITGEKGADLAIEGNHLLEDSIVASDSFKGGCKIVIRTDSHLALAVVAEPAGLQDGWAAKRLHRQCQILQRSDLPEARRRDAEAGGKGLLCNPVLCRLERGRARAGKAAFADDLHGGSRHIFEFAGHGIDAGCEPAQTFDVVIGCGGCRGCHLSGRASLRIRGIDMRPDAELCGGNGNHPAKLAAAKNADAGCALSVAADRAGHDGRSATESVCA